MFQLIYASTATRPLSEGELDALVEHARDKNERLDVTGVLVHRNGSFLHVLEGEEETVRRLYKAIRADERHRWVTLLKASALHERDFPETPLSLRDDSEAGARQPPLAIATESDASETITQFQQTAAPTLSPDLGSSTEAASS